MRCELKFASTKKSMTYDKDQLKKWSGGDKARTTYKVPTLKFNGNTGKFTKFPVGDFTNGTEVTDVELNILRRRRIFTSYEKAPDGGVVRMFTNEHNSYGDHITVFETKTGSKIKAIASGVIEDLRSELPTLRINDNCYCLYDGEIHKFVVKGKTRQSLVDTVKELQKENTELFEKTFKLVPTQEAGQGGNTYYYVKFEVVGDADLNVIGPHMEEIGKTMDKIDEEYKEKNNSLKKEAEDLNEVKPEEDDNEEDIIPIDDADSDEIKPEDIPF